MQVLIVHQKNLQFKIKNQLSDPDFKDGWRMGIAASHITAEDILFYQRLGFEQVEDEPSDFISSLHHDKVVPSSNLFDRSTEFHRPIY